MQKHFFIFLFGIVLLCALPSTAHAHDVPDFSKTGSITIKERHPDLSIDGCISQVYRVGDIIEADGDFIFSKTAELLNFNGNFEDTDNLQSPEFAKNIALYIEQYGLTPTQTKTEQNNKIVFDNLELGLYLVVETKAAAGYKAMKPFLISVPLWEGDSYLYDIVSYGKFERIKENDPADPPNQPDPPDIKLPQTGQLNWPIPLLAICGFAMITFGCVLRSKPKK